MKEITRDYNRLWKKKKDNYMIIVIFLSVANYVNS